MDCLPKKEEYDEITEIANKIKELNRKQMVVKPNITISKCVELPPPVPSQPQILPPDWTSIQGQFGWIEIDKCTLPYLMRSDRRYIAERVANAKLFLDYKVWFKDDILGDQVKKLKLTPYEANLLNEINFKHCDSFYGKSVFNVMDHLISAEDINEMNAFYKFIHKCFVEKTNFAGQRCGFITISGKNCVPYVSINNQQYVPLFYFEGDCQYLEEMAITVRDWDLVYLKFSCKIQGIRKELYEKETIHVVHLDIVKQYFLPGTVFEEFILKDNPKWFEELSLFIFKNEKTYQSELQNDRSSCKLNIQQKPTGNPPISTLNKYYQINKSVGNNTTKPVNSSSINSVNNNSILKQYTSQNSTSGPTKYTMFRIPDIICGEQQVPYTFKTVRIGNIFLHRCINMEPFHSGNLLVTLEEIANFIFRVPVDKVVYALRAMGLVTYLPNNKQSKMLETVGLKNTRGVIQVDVFRENLPQLGYILSST